MAAWATVNLPGVDFGRLTLRHFRRLQDAWLDEQRRQDWRAGALYQVTANAFRGRGQRPARAADAFPSLKVKKATKPLSNQQIVAKLKAVLGAPRG